MRVLMLSQFYAPVVGGTERAVENLAGALSRRGHEVAVATLATGEAPAAGGAAGTGRVRVRVHRLRTSAMRLSALFSDPERPHAPPAPDPEAVLALRGIVARERPDVVHAHDWLVASYLPLRRLGAPPLVMSLHDHGLVCATRRLMRGPAPCDGPGPARCAACATRHYGALTGAPVAALVRLFARSARARTDMFLPVSEAVAETCGLAPRGLRYQVVPNFLPTEPAAPARVPWPAVLPPKGFLLFVGDAVADKGIDVLLDAHARLGDAPELLVIGRTDEREPRLRAPGVRALGPRPHALVLEAMRRAALAVVPSRVPETFGMVALEAMASGLPVLAARAGALPELVVHDRSGVLVPPGDPVALAGELRALLADPARRARLAVGARLRAMDYREAAVVPRVERVYRGLAGEGAREGDRR